METNAAFKRGFFTVLLSIHAALILVTIYIALANEPRRTKMATSGDYLKSKKTMQHHPVKVNSLLNIFSF